MRVVLIFCAAILMAVLTACGGGDKPAATKEVEKTGDPLPPGLFVDKAPAGELPLAEAKKSAKAGETIVLRGLVRGVTTAFVPNRAIVQLADEVVPKCPMYPERPWDLHC